MAHMSNETKGMIYGLLGVIGFSLTLPTTKIAVSFFDPIIVGLGRAIIAAILAAILLLIRRERIPSAKELKSLGIVSLGVIVGFPLLSAWAMQRVPATHGAIVLALLPLATAGAATFFAGERPSRSFWLASVVGSLAVLAYAVYSGVGHLQLADLALAGAVVAAAIGYAEGGKLARTMGGWQVISWALVIACPFLLIPVAVQLPANLWQAPVDVWLSFGYVSIISQFVGFFAWYRGLALGGVARVSQTQYLQPFFTIVGSAIILGETITWVSVVAAMIVITAVARGKNAPVKIATPSQNASVG